MTTKAETRERAIEILRRSSDAIPPSASDLEVLASMPVDEVRRLRASELRYMEAQFESVEVLARADTKEGGVAPLSRFEGSGHLEIPGDPAILYEDQSDAERAQDPLGPREVEHVATSERACGWGKDVVLQSAWDFTDFFAIGGPLLHNHSREEPVLGRVLSMRKARVNGERVWIARSQFLPEGINTFADMVWQMVALDFVRGVSVGFRVLESINPTDEDRVKHGMGQWSVTVTKADLVELSVTALPADKAAVKLREAELALTRAAEEGFFNEALVARYFGRGVATAAPAPFDASQLVAEIASLRAAHDASEQRILDAVRTLRERVDEMAGGEPVSATEEPIDSRGFYAALFASERAPTQSTEGAALDPLSLVREAVTDLAFQGR